MGVEKILSLVDVAGGPDRYRQYKSVVEKLLPKSVDASRYMAMYLQIANKWIDEPKVTDKCSILTCLFNAPKLALNPDPVFGQIYFIPYKGVLTYQIGYKGMIQLSLNSGKISNVRAGLVFEKDKWHYHEDETGQHYHFEPALELSKQADRGREIFGYSIFTDERGRPNIHIMESWHIEDIKKLVLARMGGKSTPWSDKLFEPEMRKKTVIRRHWKTEPMSAEIAQVIEHEEALERGDALKEKHPELEEIMDGLISGAKQQVAITEPPATTSEPGQRPMTAEEQSFVNQL